MSDGGLQWHAEVGAQEEQEHLKGIGMENRKVYEAINKVQKELATEGIGKGRRNQQQGYNFRGIDDIYNAVSPLLAKHGLCILPRVISRECIERQSTKGGALFYVTCAVEFDFVSSADGSTHVVKMWGEAMDSGDKATNKAMSAAYKYAVMQAFAIPTEGDNDADSTTHEVAPAPKILPAPITPSTGVWESMDDGQRAVLSDVAGNVSALISEGRTGEALDYIHKQGLDADERVALNTRFGSKERSAMKKEAADRRANDLLNTP